MFTYQVSQKEMHKSPPGPKICSAQSCVEVLVQVGAQVIHCACLCALLLGPYHMGKPARPSHPVTGCCFRIPAGEDYQLGKSGVSWCSGKTLQHGKCTHLAGTLQSRQMPAPCGTNREMCSPMHSCCSSTPPGVVGYVGPGDIIQLPLLWVAEYLWAGGRCQALL